MSGHAGEYSYSDIIAAGAADFLVKPFGMEELKAKIERIERERQTFNDLRRTNEELRDVTTYLENVLEHSPDGIAIVDTRGRFTKWNKAAEEAYGYSFEELKGKSTFDLYLDKAELEKMLSQLRQEGFVRKYEIEMKKKDGSTAPFEMSIGLLKDENGGIIGSIGMGRDVSDLKKALARLEVANTQLRQEIIERRRAEETLSESERRFREILENIYLLAISLDAQGRITFCNDFFLRLTGWQREELLGCDWFEACLPQESRSMMRNSYLEEIQHGEITTHYEDEIVTYLGKRCLIAWNNTLLRDPRGNVIGATMIGRDVGQRRLMEKELRKASAEMELLIASIPSVLIELTQNNHVIRWNLAAEKTFELTSYDVLGVSLSECGIRWDWEKVSASLLKCHAKGAFIREDDIRFVKPDGTEGLLGITISPIGSELEGMTGLIILGADITERRLLERQLAQAQKLESIGQLAAGIAHEINTPTQYVGDNTRFLLGAFKDLEQLLDEYAKMPEAVRAGISADDLKHEMAAVAEEADLEYLREEIPKAIQQSLEGVERVSKIVGAMKEFSHPGTAEKVAIDINRAIESTITVARNEWKYVAEMVTDFDLSMPLIPCLPGEFNQVVLNMIINAAHAIADANKAELREKGTITVSTRSLDEHAELRISDTGTGIPESIRPRIFDPFFTTKDVGKGTGQGLAIAHSVIVDKHGGTIRFESEMGKGTTFVITLPTSVITGLKGYTE
jgi:PAS domain S-box-containing protein